MVRLAGYPTLLRSSVAGIASRRYRCSASSSESLPRTPASPRFRLLPPDYTVVQVSLLGMTGRELKTLRASLENEQAHATCPSVAAHARASVKYLDQRLAAKDIAEERRYVNVAGGAEGGVPVLSALAWLRARNLGAWSTKVDGPLLRATEPRSGQLTHMPMQVTSTYEHHVKALKAAYEVSSALDEPDLELDLQGLEAPKWANHSLRRGSDRMARDAMERSGVSVVDIDAVFGWNEAQRKKDMQLHYEGLDRARRVGRARVTMYV